MKGGCRFFVGKMLVDGPFQQSTWVSEEMDGFKRGDYVSLKLHSNATSGRYSLRVFLNWQLVKEEIINLPYTTVEQ